MSDPPLNFELWLPRYMEFRKEAALVVALPVPGELGQLQVESSGLEPMRWKSEKMRARAINFYYQAKNRWFGAFVQEGWPRSSLQDITKAKCSKELWAREDAAGLCRVINSRAWTVERAIKSLEGKK